MSRWPGRLITKNPVTPAGPSPLGAAPGIWTLPEMAYWQKQGVWPDTGADPYWANTTLLMSTSALSNASNNQFVDSSSAFNPISRNGNTLQGTFTPYGNQWSNYFDGSGDYLTTTASSAFSFGTGDFTVECWFNRSAGTSAGGIVGAWTGTASTSAWLLTQGSSDTRNMRFGVSDGTTTTFYEPSSAVLSNSAWVHLAVTRSGGTLYMFANGALVGSYSNTTNISVSAPVGIGAVTNGSFASTGYISNVRVVKGTALYTSAFARPSAPLTAVSGTSLLTCQSNRLRDASANNFAITKNGDTSVSAFGPFVLPAPGAVYNQNDISYWSGYFDGSGDYLNTAASSSLGLTGDWTVEGWLYQTSTAGTQIFLDTRGSGATGFGIYCSLTGFTGGPGAFGYATNSALVATSSTVIPLNAWTHLAVTRSGNTITGYINGVSAFTYTESRTLSSTMSYFIGADYTGAANAYGYMSNFRVVRGTAVYTGNFTPPAAPLTAISGTSLLTLQNAAFTDNSANNFAITANGNVTVTGKNPYQIGYYSNYFDGNGDYLTVGGGMPSGQGTAFTLEFWTYISTAKTNIFTAGSAGGSLEFYVQGNGQLVLDNTGVVGICASSAGVLNAGTWAHIALTRTTGNLYTAYVNGVAVMSGTNNTSMTANTTIGWHRFAPANYLNGYISNFRVTNTLVYSGNFTPPTAPLTAISGTSLLTCQANRLIDSSSNAYTITRNGDVSVQSFDPLYSSTISSSGGSVYFDGNGDWLASPDSPAWDFPGDFTVEAWVYPTGSGNRTIMSTYASPASGWMLRTDAGTDLNFTWGDSLVVGAPSTPLTINAWNHVAATRSGSTARMFLNGALVATATNSTNLSNTSPLYIGTLNTGNLSWMMTGYMAGMRVLNGTAAYTAAFTPPAAPPAPTSSAVLLVNGMNAGVYDAALQNEMETTGGVQVSSVQAKYGTTSIRFNGNSDYITMPSTLGLTFGRSDFTIEGWFYITTYSGGPEFFDARPASTNGAYPAIAVDTSGVLVYYVSGANQITGGTVAALNTWNHFALTRSDTSTRLFLNGVQQGSTYYDTNNYLLGANRPIIGGNGYAPGAASGVNGYIDDLRVTKGIARYTANFTPPTAALPIY